MKTIETRKAQLEARLAELQDNLLEIEDALDDEPNPDVEDRASERESDEVLEGLGNMGLREIQMIRAALERVAEGTYGECAKCGEEISQERLDLLPHTPLCRNCAA
ncbi:MAG: TraR/DksA family transcriptional regulator [Rhodobacteraceae bacterium]|nr:TraR/DksA family transcriptional regulator [Paracoccaceae bacterium]